MNSKATVIVIHGYQGHPDTGWKLWLKQELGKLGVQTFLPPMPTPNTPKEDEWVATIAEQVKNASEPIILVGHSLGGSALLRYLEHKPEKQITGAIFLAAAVDFTTHADHPDVALFLEQPIDFDAIKKHSAQFLVINSTNDDAIAPLEGEILSKELNCRRLLLHNRGHFSAEEGTTEIPELLKEIRELLSL